MTREEARREIDSLDFYLQNHTDDYSEESHTAMMMAIKALEQEPCEDVMAIHTQGLDEGVRCAMCTNSMKSDRGCDGGCRFDEDMYKKVMNAIRNHIA